MPERGPESLSVRCPDCGAHLQVDAETGIVQSHQPARQRTVDLDRSQDILQRQQQDRDQRFQQSIQAEKSRDALLNKKFAQSLKRVQENPNEPPPLRDVDLD